MKKQTLIKYKLRESLLSHMLEDKDGETNTPEVTNKTKATADKPEDKEVSTKKIDKDYQEVQRKLSDSLLKSSQVMQAAGLGKADNAGDRSYFSKRLHKEKNDDGSTYMFNDKELATLIKVINNPMIY